MTQIGKPVEDPLIEITPREEPVPKRIEEPSRPDPLPTEPAPVPEREPAREGA